MITRDGERDVTVYVGFRPFAGEWVEKNEAVLAGLRWQDAPGLKVKFVCWPTETETIRYAADHGFACVVVPWWRHYVFPGPQRSFKMMFETCLMDCDTEIFVYINGDIVLGPGVIPWLQRNIDFQTLYSLPRHNWEYSGPLQGPADFHRALAEAVPEEWTAVDLFAMRATEARKHIMPAPPFILTAGSMDSWLVLRAGELGWRRALIPPDNFAMLHIEHPFSHPLKPGAAPDKLAKWTFNCGVYDMATMHMPHALKMDSSLKCFDGGARYIFKHGAPTCNYRDNKELYQSPTPTDATVDGPEEAQ